MATKRWVEERRGEEAQAARERQLPLLVHALLALEHHRAGRHGIDQENRVRAVLERARTEAAAEMELAGKERIADIDRRKGRERLSDMGWVKRR